MKNLITILSLMTFLYSSPNTLWTKVFGNTGDNRGNCARETSDGGIIFTGQSEGDVWLVKTDSDGNEEWSRTYGGSDYESGNDVHQTLDGGYIIAGRRNNGGNTFYIIKTVSDGTTQWAKNFGYSNGELTSISQTSDGGYISLGYTRINNNNDIILNKRDSDGNEQWNKVFSFLENDDITDYAYEVVQTSDGGYLIAGFTDNQDDDFIGLLIKTDSDGNEEWKKTYDGGSYLYDILETSDGDFIIGGYANIDDDDNDSNIWLFKIDSDGNEEWNKQYNYSNGDYLSENAPLNHTNDGGYIMAGSSRPPNSDVYGYHDAIIIKTDSDGNEKWSKHLGGSLDESAKSVFQNSNGEYIVFGMSQSYGDGDWDALLIKLEPEIYGCMDELACNYDSAANLDDDSCDYSCNDSGEYALRFDGVNDYVDTNISREVLSDMTIEGWFRYEDSTAQCYQPIFGSSSGDFFIGKACSDEGNGILVIDGNPEQDGNWSSDYFDLNHPDADPLNAWDGNWHHIAYVFTDQVDGGNGKLFVDGNLYIDSYFNKSDTFETFFIANSFVNNNIDNEDLYRYFDGDIDNVMITNSAKYTEQFNPLNQHVSDDILAEYRINEGTSINNQLIDFSGNQKHGDIYSGPTWVDGAVFGCTDGVACNWDSNASVNDGSCEYTCRDNGDYAVFFDSQNDYIEIPNYDIPNDLNDINDALSVSLWFRTGKSGRVQYMFGNETAGTSSGYSLHMRENGQLWFQMVDVDFDKSYQESLEQYNDDQWHHFVATWSSDDTGKIYIDGQEVEYSDNSEFQVVNYNQSESDIWIGNKNNSNDDNSFDGALDEIKVWHRCLSSDEIQNVYQNNRDDSSDYLAYWKLNQGNYDVNFAVDHSGNQYHGNFHNTSWVIQGCTDEIACNYNEDATENDGSCDYSCHDNGEFSIEGFSPTAYINLPEMDHDGASSYTMSFKVKFWDLSNDHNQQVVNRQECCNGSDLLDLSWNKNTETFHFITQDDDGSNYHNYDGFSPNLNEWYYITLQREAGVAKRMFVNGEKHFEIDDPNSSLSLQNLRIGNKNDGNNDPNLDEPAHMNFDDFQMWSKALTESEILTYMTEELSGSEESLLAYYKIDEGSGSSMYDFSGNGEHAQFIGTISWDDEQQVLGCIDEYACNYDETANSNDFSCEYSCHDNGDYALYFNGTGDAQVDISDFSGKTIDFNALDSFSIFMNIESDGNWDDYPYQTFFRQDGCDTERPNVYIGIAPDGLNFGVSVDGLYDELHVAQTDWSEDNDWKQLLFVWDGDYASIYINGDQVATTNGGNQGPVEVCENGYLTIGSGDGNTPVHGMIDNVAVLDFDVTSRYGYYDLSDYDPDDFVAYWKFNQGQDGAYPEVLIDHSGNEFHGIIQGADWTSNTEGCTDSGACNYDENATLDDGSCIFFEGNTYYVSEDGDNNNCGLEDYPFALPDYALSQTEDGDTIRISSGRYLTRWTEMTIENNVVIIGEDKENTILDGFNSKVIYIHQNSSPTLDNLTIRGTSNQNQAGGIKINGASPILKNLIIEDNDVLGDGGGLYISKDGDGNAADPTIINCIFRNNYAGSKGGAVYLTEGAAPQFYNCLFHKNVAADRGGAISSGTTYPTFINCTFVDNEALANGTGSAIDLRNNSNAIITNSIILPDNGDIINYNTGSSVSVSYSNCAGSCPEDDGTNIDEDPKFVDYNLANDIEENDFNLLFNSPCIDTGDPSITDLDGTRSDMGAYYYDQIANPLPDSQITLTINSDSIDVDSSSFDLPVNYQIEDLYDEGLEFYSFYMKVNIDSLLTNVVATTDLDITMEQNFNSSTNNLIIAGASASPLDELGTLLTLTIEDSNDNWEVGSVFDISITDAYFDVDEYDTILDDCQISIVAFGCTNNTACNYNGSSDDGWVDDGSCTFPSDDGQGNYGGNTTDGTSEIFDCEGSCLVDSDCLGVCGGGAVIDECGVCDGEGVDADGDGNCDDVDDCVSTGGDHLVYDQDGNEVEDPNFGGYDECGLCNGPGPEFECSEDELACEISSCTLTLGDVDENGLIQPFDASYILQYLTENELLDPELDLGYYNADVNETGDISAYDATVVLKYIVELIDELPCPDCIEEAQGLVDLFNLEVEGSSDINLPINLSDADNIYSFELEFSYDVEKVEFSDIEWPEARLGFLTQHRAVDGILKVTGATGMSPISQEDLLGTLIFTQLDDFTDTEICLSMMKFNDNEPIHDRGCSLIESVLSVEDMITDYALNGSYPNPFNPATTISYDVPDISTVNISVYNTNGQLLDVITNSLHEPGRHTVVWDGGNYSSGIYIIRMRSDKFIQSHKVMLVK